MKTFTKIDRQAIEHWATDKLLTPDFAETEDGWEYVCFSPKWDEGENTLAIECNPTYGFTAYNNEPHTIAKARTVAGLLEAIAASKPATTGMTRIALYDTPEVRAYMAEVRASDHRSE